jgi:hypothetical protein
MKIKINKLMYRFPLFFGKNKNYCGSPLFYTHYVTDRGLNGG